MKQTLGDFMPACLRPTHGNQSLGFDPFRWEVVRSTSTPIVGNFPDHTWPEQGSSLSYRRGFPTPKIAHGVAKFVVPLRPPRWKTADLVTARAAIPGLGDQLDGRERRILADCL
jgi:hypothetical protein